MKPRIRFVALSRALSLVLFVGSGLFAAPALATLYWDANGNTAGSGTPAAATWDTGTNWTNDSSGGSPVNGWTNGQDAVFSAGTETAGTWTITIGGTVQTNSITFNGATNSTIHNINGGVIDMGASPLTITSTAAGATTGRSKTIASKITGSGGVILAADGDTSSSGGGSNSLVALTGANDFTGGVSVTAGLVSAASVFGDVSNSVTLNGGGLFASAATTFSRNLAVGASGGTLRASAAVTLSGNMSGAGNLNRTDASTAIFTGDLSLYSGSFNNNNGSTSFATNLSPTGAVAINAGSVWVGNSGTSGSLASASSITVAAGSSLYIRRSDTVSASAILPATINLPGSTSNVEFNPTINTGILNFDRDLGTASLLGQFRVSGGTVNLASGTDLMVTTISIGLQSTTNRGVLNIGTGSTLSARTLNLGETTSQSGTVNQSDGLVTLSSGGYFRIGHWNNNTNPGTVYNLTGGTLDATALSANTATNDKMVNVGWDGQGDMVVGGGGIAATLKAYGLQIDANGDSATYNDTLTVSTNGTVEIGAGGAVSASANDKLIANGGTLKATATSTWSAAFQANASTNTTVSADAVALTLSNNITGTGTLTLTTPNSGSVILGGGTGSTSIAPVLAGSGVTVNKTGTGTVILAGANTYTGVTNVTTGTLALTGALGSDVVVADGANLAGEGILNGNLTLGVTTGGTLTIDPTTPGALAVNGSVTLIGTNSLAFSKLPTAVGATSIPILTHTGGLGGTPGTNLVLTGMSSYRTPVMSDDGTTLSVSFLTKNLTWTGTGGGTWDVGSSSNWSDGAASAFYSADRVTFDDSGTNTAVTLAGSIAPSLVTVNTSTNAYTLTSSAGNLISGLGSLYKTGSSILTMVGANSYTGGTIVSNGAINLRTAGTLGTGDIVLGDASTGSNNVALYLDTNRVNFGTKVIVSSNGTGTATLGSRVNVTGTGDNNQFTSIVLQKDVTFDSNATDRTDYENVSGTGNITIVGAGRSLFPTVNTFVGNLTINTTGATDGLQLGTNSAQFNAVPDATNVTISATGKLRLSYANYATEAINALNGSGTVNNNGGLANYLSIGAGGGDGSFSGTIVNGGGTIGVIKSGAGTQVLSGTNTFTGGLYITGGTLAFSADAALGGAPDGTLAFNGLVSAGGSGYTSAPTVTVNGGGGSGGTLTAQITTNAVSRLDTGAATGAGSGYSFSPTLAFTGGAGTGAAGFGVLKGQVVLNGGTLRTDTAMTFTRPMLINGTSNGFNTNGNTVTIDNLIVGAGGLRKTGAGTLFLTKLNTFTGPMVAGGGILSLPVIPNGGIASIIGQSTSAGANLMLDGGGTLQYTGTTASTDRAFSTGTGGGTFEIPTGVTLTTGGGSGATYALAGTLTKTGNGRLKLVSYTGSTATAASDLVINQGSVEFATGYFNASPFGKNGLVITVNAGTTLLTSAAHALGGDNIDSGTSLGQVRVIGGTATFNGTQYIAGGTVNTTEGRLLLDGGTVNGTADLRVVPNTVVTVLPNTNGSVISNTGGIVLTYANLVADVADGAAADDLLISVPISANNGVVKNGAGNMKVSGVNTYAGNTTVNTGKLTVSNPTGSGTGTGAVTVAAAGTLGGEGAISGSVAVAGTLAPGNTSGASGTLTTGALTLTGTYVCQVNGTQADKVAVNGNLDITGAILNLSIQGTLAPVYVIASYTGTLTGTFGTMTGVPAGYSVNLNTATKQIELVSGDAGPTGDIDHDGITNLMEHVLGGNPSVSDVATISPKLTRVPGVATLKFKRTDSSELDTILVLQYSSDLETWNDIPIGPNSDDLVTVVENGTDPDDITVTLPVGPPLDQRMFLRLKASQP